MFQPPPAKHSSPMTNHKSWANSCGHQRTLLTSSFLYCASRLLKTVSNLNASIYFSFSAVCLITNLTVFVEDPGHKQSSMVIIFSVWKTMIGSAVVSLPWAYQQAGLIMGCLVTCSSFLVSYYTCYLIIRSSRRDSDFSDTVRRYYGTAGYYTGAISSSVLLTGVCIVYFVIQTQLLYPLTLSIYVWCTGNKPAYLTEPTFD